MKIQLLSDLHLESNPGFAPQPAPQADVLVLAGDIGSYQSGSALPLLDDPDFGLGRFSPRRGLLLSVTVTLISRLLMDKFFGVLKVTVMV